MFAYPVESVAVSFLVGGIVGALLVGTTGRARFKPAVVRTPKNRR